jgi:hypothetical protein
MAAQVTAAAQVEGPGCLTKCGCCATLFKAVDAPWKVPRERERERGRESV